MLHQSGPYGVYTSVDASSLILGRRINIGHGDWIFLSGLLLAVHRISLMVDAVQVVCVEGLVIETKIPSKADILMFWLSIRMGIFCAVIAGGLISLTGLQGPS